MEDNLGPAARLVDFLRRLHSCTLDSGLKMHFEIESMSVHIFFVTGAWELK